MVINPTVLICTYQRREITCFNIESLMKHQTVEIILVVSGQDEKEFYQREFPNIYVIDHPNRPLGEKWDRGVQEARTINANPLIILGSDDILGDNFIENCTKLTLEGHHFIGLQRWYIHHKNKAYLCDYMAKQPLGGGRSYSYELLEKLDWKLFETSKERHLDDYAWHKIQSCGLKVKWVRDVVKEGLLIHAIKGDWEVMNKFNLNHPNIKLISTHASEEILPNLSGRF